MNCNRTAVLIGLENVHVGTAIPEEGHRHKE